MKCQLANYEAGIQLTDCHLREVMDLGPPVNNANSVSSAVLVLRSGDNVH